MITKTILILIIGINFSVIYIHLSWSVNGCKTIFGFNYLLNNNGTLAHEFGHAFGLEHTFKTESKDEKKKETVEESKFYKNIDSNLKINHERFNVNSKYYKKYWNKYIGVKFTFESLDIVLKELMDKVLLEKVNTKIIKTSTSETIINSISTQKEGESKENFMDYLKNDGDRKALTIVQISKILIL